MVKSLARKTIYALSETFMPQKNFLKAWRKSVCLAQIMFMKSTPEVDFIKVQSTALDHLHTTPNFYVNNKSTN